VAAEIREACGAEAELIAGGGGIFDIHINGILVFTKKNVDRFPKPGEIAATI